MLGNSVTNPRESRAASDVTIHIAPLERRPSAMSLIDAGTCMHLERAAPPGHAALQRLGACGPAWAMPKDVWHIVADHLGDCELQRLVFSPEFRRAIVGYPFPRDVEMAIARIAERRASLQSLEALAHADLTYSEIVSSPLLAGMLDQTTREEASGVCHCDPVAQSRQDLYRHNAEKRRKMIALAAVTYASFFAASGCLGGLAPLGDVERATFSSALAGAGLVMGTTIVCAIRRHVEMRLAPSALAIVGPHLAWLKGVLADELRAEQSELANDLKKAMQHRALNEALAGARI